jgi:hypothetical protein
MKKIISSLRTRPALFSLVIFLGMIVPSVLLFPTAETENQSLMVVLVGLVVLANLAAVFPLKPR